MKPRVLGLGAAILAIVLAVWVIAQAVGGSSGKPVTEAEARAHLAQLVAAGRAHDFDKLCRLAGAVSNCRALLHDAGTDAVPTTVPEVVSATYHEPQTDDGTPGWVLVVSGTDGLGKPYQTEVLVFRDDESKVKATNAVYWSNAKIDFGDPNQGTSPA